MAPWILRPAANDRPRVWAACALIVAATVAAYHNSGHGPFGRDPVASVVTSPERPVHPLSLALDYAAGGAAVADNHGVNLVIHVLAALTLFGIVRRMVPPSPAGPGGFGVALAAALVWAVHPLQTESVTDVNQRAELLGGWFFLLTLYCFVRATEAPGSGAADAGRRRGWLGAAAAACLLGMGTSEVMVTAPLIVLLFDRTFVAGSFRGAWRERGGFHLALAGTWLLLALILAAGGARGVAEDFGVSLRPWEYWLTQFAAVGRYLALAVWPHPLVFDYGAFRVRDFREIALPLVVVLGLIGATLRALWRRPALGFLGAWFFGILAPTSLVPGTTQMIAEHRTYLPLAAVIVAGVLAVRASLSPRFARWRPWLASGVALPLAAATIARNETYRSELALWADTIAKRPENARAHFVLASARERAGDLAAAEAGYGRTLELKPDHALSHQKLGELLGRRGQRRPAIEHFEAALRLEPKFADAHRHVGLALLAERRFADALAHLEEAARLAPGEARNRHHLAQALVAAGLADEAVPEYQAALRLDPTLTAVHREFASTLLQLGRTDDAIAHYEAALRAKPDDAETHHQLGRALLELGRSAEAAKQFAKVLELAPDFPEARANLERARQPPTP